MTRLRTAPWIIFNFLIFSFIVSFQLAYGNEQQGQLKNGCLDIDVGSTELTPYQRANAVNAICAELAQAAQSEYSREVFQNKKLALSGYRADVEYKIMQRHRALDLQYFFSIFSFIAAIGFLLFGFYLAHQQFLRDAKDQNKSVSTIKISRDGIEISSSVMGLMVLFLSLLFFYLFLKEVYSITEIESSKESLVHQANTPSTSPNGAH